MIVDTRFKGALGKSLVFVNCEGEEEKLTLILSMSLPVHQSSTGNTTVLYYVLQYRVSVTYTNTKT